MPNAYVTRETFAFLREIAAHNDREWFRANKQRYLDEVRDPLLQLICDLGPRLRKISKNVVADPRPVGGSLFRIHRDTRFAKDKSPYKTYAGMTFLHTDGKELPAGYYLHVEPGGCYMTAGLWYGEPAAVKDVRDAIVAHPAHWRRVAGSRAFDLDDNDDALVRPPRGYDPDHPFIEDLKRKSVTSTTDFTHEEVLASDFPDGFVKECRRKAPLMEFLCNALGRPW
jgi:uncharacterized protein (TIGR02453 family)